MTGVLEQMQAQIAALTTTVDAIKNWINTNGSAQSAAPQQAAQQAVAAQQQQAAGLGGLSLGGGLGATAPAVQNVTAEMITGLITPYLENEAVKQQLTAQLSAMGIGALGDTPPEKYGELYGRFQQVIAAAAGNGATIGAATNNSII